MSAEVVLMPDAVEAVVRAVPGVGDVFRARPDVAALAGHARDLVVDRRLRDLPRVLIRDAVVRVAVASDGSVPAPAIARAVHDAVLEHAAATGAPCERVEVTVARID